MGIVINKCAKCGHEWPQSSPVPPRRCPAEGCRTMRWRLVDDKEFYEELEATCKKRAKKATKAMEKQTQKILERYK